MFDHVNFINNQLWGAWIENYNNSKFDTLYGTNNQVGCIARVASGGALYNEGNSRWESTACNTLTGGLGRGLVTWTRASSNLTQDTYIADAPNGGSNTLVTAAATMTNASCNITVPDATKFPMDMGVVFDANANGFPIGTSGGNNTNFFVVSNNGSTTVTVSPSLRGTCQAATGSAAMNMLTKGYPIMEVANLDSGSGFIGIKMYAIDIEGSATAQLLLQGIGQNWTFDASVLGGDTYSAVVERTATRGVLFSQNTTVVDQDIGSAGNLSFVFNGANPILSLLRGNGSGIYLDPTGYFQWGIPKAGRWNFGDGQGNAFSSALDTIYLSKQLQGYVNWGANANGNVAQIWTQGGANGGAGAGQGEVVCGLVGTATDADYKFNTTNTGLASGDFLCQTWNGSAYAPIWWSPGGSNNILFGGATASRPPSTLTGTSGSAAANDGSIIVNASGTFTLTLPTCAAANKGRWMYVKSIAAQLVNSASSNVAPIGSATPGTAILSASAGKWAALQCDGSSTWDTMAAN